MPTRDVAYTVSYTHSTFLSDSKFNYDCAVMIDGKQIARWDLATCDDFRGVFTKNNGLVYSMGQMVGYLNLHINGEAGRTYSNIDQLSYDPQANSISYVAQDLQSDARYLVTQPLGRNK